jgi:hypothetical protein
VKVRNQFNKTKYSMERFSFLDRQQVIKYMMQIDYSATSRLNIFKEIRFFFSKIESAKKY